MTTEGDSQVVEQITKQLNKLIDVVKVLDLSLEEYVGRELLLIKIEFSQKAEAEVLNLGGQVLFKDDNLLNVEFVGTSEELDDVVSSLAKLNPLEVVRTGLSGISSTTKTLTI